MHFRKRALLVFLILATVVSAVGQTRQRSYAEKDFRDAQARSWRDGFTKLNAQIPTLSPAEERWLKAEVDDTILNAGGSYTPRSLDAMDSREYQLRIAKPHTQEIILTLNNILSSVPPNAQQEAELWTHLAALFMDGTYWQSVNNLVVLKIVQKDINGLTGLYFENHTLWAKQMLKQVVLPYLRTLRR